MVTRASVFRDVFKDLRKDLFFGEWGHSSNVDVLRKELTTAADLGRFTIWRRLRTLGVEPDVSEAATVLGVIMEIGLDDGSVVLVFGLSDGSASVYFSTGGGNIGGQARPQINAAARELAAIAGDFVPSLPLAQDHPLPADGGVRFSILTPAGVHAAEARQDDLVSGASPLAPLFEGGAKIIAGFRSAGYAELNDETSYVNCLLTALVRGDGEAAVLDDGQPLPDPATFVSDPKDLEWIGRLAIPVDRLSARKVIATLLRTAGFRRFHPRERERTGRAKLATSEWMMEDVAFSVSRSKEQGHLHVQVRILRSSQT
jgi:hypothetical protein